MTRGPAYLKGEFQILVIKDQQYYVENQDKRLETIRIHGEMNVFSLEVKTSEFTTVQEFALMDLQQ